MGQGKFQLSRKVLSPKLPFVFTSAKLCVTSDAEERPRHNNFGQAAAATKFHISNNPVFGVQNPHKEPPSSWNAGALLVSQTAAALKYNVCNDEGNRHHHFCEAAAASKCFVPNAGDGVRDHHMSQAPAAMKC